jgi:hypothetical protein
MGSSSLGCRYFSGSRFMMTVTWISNTNSEENPAQKMSGSIKLENGAGDGIRTRNRLFTKQVLYR